MNSINIKTPYLCPKSLKTKKHWLYIIISSVVICFFFLRKILSDDRIDSILLTGRIKMENTFENLLVFIPKYL